MPSPKKPPTTIPRRQLGRYLRDMRQEAGIWTSRTPRGSSSAAPAPCSVSRRERSRPHPNAGHPSAVPAVRHPGDVARRCSSLAAAAASNDGDGLWWHEYGDVIRADFELYVSLEASASKLTVFRPDIISGLFQTATYARALDTSF